MNEHDIRLLMDNPAIKAVVNDFRKQYSGSEQAFAVLTDNDLLSTIMLGPVIGVALSNNHLNFFESLYLTHLSRLLSEGGYYHVSDPVLKAAKATVKRFEELEKPLYAALKEVINALEHKSDLPILDMMINMGNVQKDGLSATKTMNQEAFLKIKVISENLLISSTSSYKKFLQDYQHLEPND
ncbi:MAG: hypothetical protein EAZ57_10700 [Cytophagales bacterium]|nr:MAG: hypothetical protein EAZ67_11305 [Cytophagales bacterium]TAF59544.1 MAG: hypothetical protein EAZ57_10700 [Cytophagales bacterium]